MNLLEKINDSLPLAPICIFVPNNIRTYFCVRDVVCIISLHHVFIARRRASIESLLVQCSARWTARDRVEDVADALARLQKEKETLVSRRGRRTCVKLSSTPLGLITFVSSPRCDAVHRDSISSNWLIPMGINVAVNSSKRRPYVPEEQERCDHSSSSDGSFYKRLDWNWKFVFVTHDYYTLRRYFYMKIIIFFLYFPINTRSHIFW